MSARFEIQLSIKEIYERLCPKCKKKLREIVKEKLTDKLVQDMLEGGKER